MGRRLVGHCRSAFESDSRPCPNCGSVLARAFRVLKTSPCSIRMPLLSAFIRYSSLAMSMHCQRGARRQPLGRDGLRSQPVRSAREHRRPARYIAAGVWPVSVPRPVVGRLDRRGIMRTADMFPSESNAQIISSIINLVCPQCGGPMSEFQCEGRCCRNWLAEWEWANQATRSPKSRVSRYRVQPMR